MRTPAELPSVLVKVNGITSQCKGDCSYQTNLVLPTLSTATLATNIVTLALDTNTPIGDISVTVGGQPCTYTEGTYSAYKCALPKHGNGDPILEAGDYTPRVYIKGKGYAKVPGTFTKIAYALTIASLTPNSGYGNGGQTVVMGGKGFPLDKTRVFQLQQCDKDVELISVSNEEIQFYSAPCTDGASTVKITYLGKEATSAFTYTGTSPLTFSAIDRASSSPVLKGFLEVTGTGFGTDKSLVKAWLMENNVKKYQLNVVEISDTTLKLRLAGGESGDFRLKITKSDVGTATVATPDVDKFSYGIYIDSVTPDTGSKFGGTKLTILG